MSPAQPMGFRAEHLCLCPASLPRACATRHAPAPSGGRPGIVYIVYIVQCTWHILHIAAGAPFPVRASECVLVPPGPGASALGSPPGMCGSTMPTRASPSAPSHGCNRRRTVRSHPAPDHRCDKPNQRPARARRGTHHTIVGASPSRARAPPHNPPPPPAHHHNHCRGTPQPPTQGGCRPAGQHRRRMGRAGQAAAR